MVAGLRVACEGSEEARGGFSRSISVRLAGTPSKKGEQEGVGRWGHI